MSNTVVIQSAPKPNAAFLFRMCSMHNSFYRTSLYVYLEADQTSGISEQKHLKTWASTYENIITYHIVKQRRLRQAWAPTTGIFPNL